jgi:hypothetical protein
MKISRPPRGVSSRVMGMMQDNDRAWFEAHPDRQYRARRWVVGESELPEGGSAYGAPYMIVRNVVPSIRIRVFVQFTTCRLEEDGLERCRPEESTDAALGWLWHVMAAPEAVTLAESVQAGRRPPIAGARPACAPAHTRAPRPRRRITPRGPGAHNDPLKFEEQEYER